MSLLRRSGGFVAVCQVRDCHGQVVVPETYRAVWRPESQARRTTTQTARKAIFRLGWRSLSIFKPIGNRIGSTGLRVYGSTGRFVDVCPRHPPKGKLAWKVRL